MFSEKMPNGIILQENKKIFDFFQLRDSEKVIVKEIKDNFDFIFNENIYKNPGSIGYDTCTGVCALGLDANEKNISSFSHQNTHYILNNKDTLNKFNDKMKYFFEKIFEKSSITPEILFFGGLIFNPSFANSEKQKEMMKDYNKYYIEFMNILIKNIKFFDSKINPTIISPKYTGDNWKSNYFFDIKNKIFYSNDILPHKENYFKSSNLKNFVEKITNL